MIEAVNLTKRFEDVNALNEVTATIKEGNVFGLVGTNGAGKSTFIRLLCGILKPDSGTVKIDGMEVYENVKAKELFYYISDDQHYFSNGTPLDLKEYYRVLYKNFDSQRFDNLMKQYICQGDDRKGHDSCDRFP